MTITAQDLHDRNIYADETTEALLGFTVLSPEELDILLSYFGFAEGRTLTVRIGGIGYRAYSESKNGAFVEVLINVASDCFSYPLDVVVKASHEASEAADHLDGCPYSVADWLTDEEGTEYWADFEDRIYDEETDSWSAPQRHRHYDAECNCPYVEDSVQTFCCTDDQELKAAQGYIDTLFL